jgi:hypothetical protein
MACTVKKCNLFIAMIDAQVIGTRMQCQTSMNVLFRASHFLSCFVYGM